MTTKEQFYASEPIAEFFSYEHLPEQLQSVSKEFFKLAKKMVNDLPKCDERTAGLRKLLEAKDCAVRAAVKK